MSSSLRLGAVFLASTALTGFLSTASIANNEFAGLGDLPGSVVSSQALDVSADGLAVVGYSESSNGTEAFLLTESGGMISLGSLAGGSSNGYAYAVNADGTVVVGHTGSANGDEAFRWTLSGGMVGLGDLAGGGVESQAYDVSADGSVVVGYSESANGLEAFRWTESGGMVGLGELTGGIFYSEAYAVNVDGTVVVGHSLSANGLEAFRWLEGSGPSSGMQSIADLLTNEGINLGTWWLQWAVGVSGDGKVIVGWGRNPSGEYAAWRAVIGTGLVSINNFTNSLGTTAGSTSSAQGQTRGALGSQTRVARHFRNRPGQQCKGNVCRKTAAIEWDSLRFASSDLERVNLAEEERLGTSLWVAGGTASATPSAFEEDSYDVSVGASVPLSDAWTFGLGFMASETDLDPRLVEGTGNTRESMGLSGYLAWEPSAWPIRAYGAAVTIDMEDDITRHYLNGVTPVTSEGERDGMTYGASLTVGWEHPLYKSITAMPYVSYEHTWISLEGYEETSGPFPAIFDKVTDTTKVSRLG